MTGCPDTCEERTKYCLPFRIPSTASVRFLPIWLIHNPLARRGRRSDTWSQLTLRFPGARTLLYRPWPLLAWVRRADQLVGTFYTGPQPIAAAEGHIGKWQTELELQLIHNVNRRLTLVLETNLGWDTRDPANNLHSSKARSAI